MPHFRKWKWRWLHDLVSFQKCMLKRFMSFLFQKFLYFFHLKGQPQERHIHNANSKISGKELWYNGRNNRHRALLRWDDTVRYEPPLVSYLSLIRSRPFVVLETEGQGETRPLSFKSLGFCFHRTSLLRWLWTWWICKDVEQGPVRSWEHTSQEN